MLHKILPVGLRLFKRIGIGRLIRFNVSKHGLGVSFGVPGFWVGRRTNGKLYISVGAPGTGISYRRDISPDRLVGAIIGLLTGSQFLARRPKSATAARIRSSTTGDKPTTRTIRVRSRRQPEVDEETWNKIHQWLEELHDQATGKRPQEGGGRDGSE